MSILYGFKTFPVERRNQLLTDLRQRADKCPFSHAPFGVALDTERVWCALTTVKRLEQLPLSLDEQRWWASRQEQLLDPTDPVYLQLVADQWGITQDPHYRRVIENIINNGWISPMVRNQARSILAGTYR